MEFESLPLDVKEVETTSLQPTEEETPTEAPSKQPGRPRIDRSFTLVELTRVVQRHLILNLEKVRVDGYKSDRKRLDTIRTRIVRVVKKIPDAILKACHSKGDYKSDCPIKYTRVYNLAAQQLKQILD